MMPAGLCLFKAQKREENKQSQDKDMPDDVIDVSYSMDINVLYWLSFLIHIKLVGNYVQGKQ